MDRLADQLTTVIQKLQDPGLAAARQAVQVDALKSLLAAGFGVVIAAFLASVASYVWKRRPIDPGIKEFFASADFAIGCGCMVIAVLIVTLAVLTTLIDPWTWVAFINPDAVLAAKILRL